MKKTMILTLLTATALMVLLDTSRADPPPSQPSETNRDAEVASPEAEVRFPDSWESFPRRDDDVLTRLRVAQSLVFPFRGTRAARPEADRGGPCLAQAGGAKSTCEQVRVISRLPACVRPEDCQAYDMTRQLAGEPEIRTAPGEAPGKMPTKE